MPSNIVDVTQAIIDCAKRAGVGSFQEQLDYALRLVALSWVARDCHLQIALLDVLIDAGASPDGAPHDALVNGNIAAAAHLVARGATLTLATALCLGRWDKVKRLGLVATPSERQFALILAALRGRAEALAHVIELGVNLNAPCAELYSHAPALHHAVSSGSLEAVKVLDVKDTVYGGTPLGWAEYGKHEKIAAYLRTKTGNKAER